MKQYIAIVTFGLGIITYAQHGPKHGHPPHHPKKIEHRHKKPKHHHTNVKIYNSRDPYRSRPLPPPPPPRPKNSGVNINVDIR